MIRPPLTLTLLGALGCASGCAPGSSAGPSDSGQQVDSAALVDAGDVLRCSSSLATGCSKQSLFPGETCPPPNANDLPGPWCASNPNAAAILGSCDGYALLEDPDGVDTERYYLYAVDGGALVAVFDWANGDVFCAGGNPDVAIPSSCFPEIGTPLSATFNGPGAAPGCADAGVPTDAGGSGLPCPQSLSTVCATDAAIASGGCPPPSASDLPNAWCAAHPDAKGFVGPCGGYNALVYGAGTDAVDLALYTVDGGALTAILGGINTLACGAGPSDFAIDSTCLQESAPNVFGPFSGNGTGGCLGYDGGD